MAFENITEKNAQRLIDLSTQMRGWTCVRKLGGGSFGTVFEVSRRGSENSALKIIPIPLSENELAEKRLEAGNDDEVLKREFELQVEKVREKEISVLETCKGEPNIVQLYEWETIPNPDNPICFYVLIRMELLIRLQDYLPGKTQKDALKMFRDIAHALEFLESRRMLHRDIKRENIMVSPRGVYKLADFGEARDILKKNAASTKAGTPYFMAPEVANGRQYDNRADIYSLAMTVYHCLYNYRYPFMRRDGHSDISSMEAYNMRVAEMRPIKPIPDLDPEFNAILLKCLAYEPTDRYPSARMLYDELSDLMNKRGFADAPLNLPRSDRGTTPTGGVKRSHKGLIITLISVLAVAIIGGTIAFVMLRPFDSCTPVPTNLPTTVPPTTVPPTTVPPTTVPPTTVPPTTVPPTTVPPTTVPPTTVPPTTMQPTTVPPTTELPTDTPPVNDNAEPYLDWPNESNGIGYMVVYPDTEDALTQDEQGNYVVTDDGAVIKWGAADGYTGDYSFYRDELYMYSGNAASVSKSTMDENSVTVMRIEKADDPNGFVEIGLVRDDYEPETPADGTAEQQDAAVEVTITVDGYEPVPRQIFDANGTKTVVDVYTIGENAVVRWNTNGVATAFDIALINTQNSEHITDLFNQEVTQFRIAGDSMEIGDLYELRITAHEPDAWNTYNSIYINLDSAISVKAYMPKEDADEDDKYRYNQEEIDNYEYARNEDGRYILDNEHTEVLVVWWTADKRIMTYDVKLYGPDGGIIGEASGRSDRAIIIKRENLIVGVPCTFIIEGYGEDGSFIQKTSVELLCE